MKNSTQQTASSKLLFKLFLTKTLVLILLINFNAYCQVNQDNLTPNGIMDNVFDQYGNYYSLSDILINNENHTINNKSSLINCTSTSYFNLYFEPGCGMENPSIPLHNARRDVVCKIFQDLSNFINSPLSSTGEKINIWVRNINNLGTNPNGVLGFASGYYCLPSGSTASGIVDSEIWKTIHTGHDSYLNLTVPLTSLGGGSNQAGLFYHGMIAFNFNDTATPPIPNTPQAILWNTDLTVTSIPSNQFDLYSVLLHEITHCLGFSSLINQNGLSKFGNNYNYFNRYDQHLKTNDSNQFLITSTGCNNFYNNSFNSALSTDVLHPNPTNASCVETTLCNDAIKFVGTNSIPVFTPNCFIGISSLSHFEDMHFPTCNSNLPYGDNYFLMCNGGNPGVIRRYLKPEERNALCDIGYNSNTIYGSSSVYNSLYNYGGTVCSGITVAGTSDGINNSGSFNFIGNVNTNILISGATILSNDTNATGFECLEDITATVSFPSSILPNSGDNTTVINFNSNLPGLHLLRYIPVNGTQKGNITYIYVYVSPIITQCTTPPSSCNLVNNGDFEANSVNVTEVTDFEMMNNKVCNWRGVNNSAIGIADYIRYYLENQNTTDFNVPCNLHGFQNDKITGNNAYAGFLCYSNSTNTSINGGILSTQLSTPLTPQTTYQLNYDISQAEFYRYRNYNIHAFISNIPPDNILTSSITNPQLANGIFLPNSTISNNTINWETASITFTTDENIPLDYQYLYIGILNNPLNTSGTNPISVSDCTNTFDLTPYNGSLYYIDNISLIANPGTLNLPATITCDTTLNSNLTTYLQSAPSNGVFSGNGVEYSASEQIYSFNPQLAGNGLATITYTYQNSNGCPITLSQTVNVNLNLIIPQIFGHNNLCVGDIENFASNVNNGVWSSSNPDVATIDSTTGELTSYIEGDTTITYTTTGICATSVSILVSVLHHTIPTFSFPTIICKGSISPILPHISDNNIQGEWFPTTIDNVNSSHYTFTPFNSCAETLNVNVTVVIEGALVANNDEITLPFSTALQNSSSIIANDTYNGIALTPNFLGIPIIFQSNTYEITANLDGTLNIPAGLPIGTYTVNYNIKNSCLVSNVSSFTINIIDANINTPKRLGISLCYKPESYTTDESVLTEVLIGDVRANSNLIDIYVTQAQLGFSINPDGTINIPANTMPGSYIIEYYICQHGSIDNCVYDLVLYIDVQSTVRANPDIFYFDTSGNFIGSNPTGNGSLSASNNIFSNDGYAADCGFSAPNSFGPVTGNITNISINQPTPAGNFNILNNGLINPIPFNIPIGSYSFTYSFCDINYPSICTDGYGWIYVVGNARLAGSLSNSVFDELIVYPNPSNGIFTVEFNKNIDSGSIEIYNVLGKKVHEAKIIKSKTIDINLINLPSGIYTLRSIDGLSTVYKLIVKE